MPPARKNETDHDDPSRPSTSRAFSPSIVPPVKRAKTSNGPSTANSRRQSTGGGRQARLEDFIDEKELQNGLLIAAMQTAEEVMKEEEEEGRERIEIDNEVISTAARIVWDALAEDWASDLVAFSRHAGRETIREEDVRLLMRRNPEMFADVLEGCEGEETEGGGGERSTSRRKWTGISLPGKGGGGEEHEETTMVGVGGGTPLYTLTSSTSTSVVPETPQGGGGGGGRGPLAHSTPMNGRSVSMLMGGKGRTDLTLPSPIQEEGEAEIGLRRNGSGRRVNRSIMDDLSTTMREEEKETLDMEEGDLTPIVTDLRHAREREEEEKRNRIDKQLEEIIVARSQGPQNGGGGGRGEREESPDLFERSEEGQRKEEEEKEEYDSFDDDIIFEEKEEPKDEADESRRLSESAALREMMNDSGEEEKKKEEEEKEERDSFDDSIQFVDQASGAATPTPKGDVPSTSSATAGRAAAAASVNAPAARAATSSSGPAREAAALPPAVASRPSDAAENRAAASAAAVSQRSSQDSFFLDDIVDYEPVVAAAAAPPPSVSSMQQPPQRPHDYDSFDDDDFAPSPVAVVIPSTKEQRQPPANGSRVPAAIGAPPKSTVASRWSEVHVEEVQSQKEQRKEEEEEEEEEQSARGTFAEDIFGILDLPGPSKPPPTAAAPTRKMNEQPTRKIAARRETPTSEVFSSFSFFGEETPQKPEEKMPQVGREDSDFLEAWTSKQTPSTLRTPRGGGGGSGARGARFPRKVDPNSKANRMKREQSTPVRLSPRPASRISEVVTFEDDDFDVSAFD